MKKILKKISVLLDKKQKFTMAALVLMMIVGAALEVASLAIVMGVLKIIVSKDALSTNGYISFTYNLLGFREYAHFEIFMMIMLIVAFVAKNAFLFLEWKAMYSFTYKNQFRTSERLLRNYLRKNYEYYLYADTAVIQRSITSDVNNMYALILAVLTLISESIILVSITTVLLINQPLLCLIIGALLAITMFAVTKILKPVMQKAGKENQDYYSGLFKWISQIVQGIKEVKVTGRENYFVEEYVKCGKGYVNAVQRYSLYNNTPKLLIEVVCVTGMLIYMIIQVCLGKDLNAEIATLGTFAVAAVKLMPSANKINNQFNAISYLEPFLMNVSDNLQDEISGKNVDMSFATGDEPKMDIKQSLKLTNISYKYPKTEKYILNDADMEIPIGAAVGVVGSSGAGKSTLIDILLGLLKVENGSICADGVNIQDSYRSWLKTIGYIPQMIFMLDGSIRDNIAFGVPSDKLDEKRLWHVLEEACLADFVKSLPEGLDTQIGERGIRLSGGQRQRIGIARALYIDPEILVLDEATSALDNDTEAAIMESVNSLHGKKTLIIIAHRLQTIEKCDMVYRVGDGKIVRER